MLVSQLTHEEVFMSTPAEVREIAAPPSFLATRKGKLTLAFLCMVGFLDFVDASIVNVALPTIRHELHFSVQSLQWVLSAYLLTYGGVMLLGGGAAAVSSWPASSSSRSPRSPAASRRIRRCSSRHGWCRGSARR